MGKWGQTPFASKWGLTPISSPISSPGADQADEAFLGGAGGEDAVAGVEAAARESAGAGAGGAVERVQQPFVDARVAVEPDGVVDARHDEVAAQERRAVRH